MDLPEFLETHEDLEETQELEEAPEQSKELIDES